MEDYVSQLQVYFQKRAGRELPRYTDYEEASGFVAIVQIDRPGTPKLFRGAVCPTKKQAKQDAARAALEALTADKVAVRAKEFHQVLIDLEHVHLGTFFDDHQFEEHSFSFHGFTSQHARNLAVPACVTVHEIASKSRDAADIGLMIYASTQIDWATDYIVVVTRDKFGDTFAEVVNSQAERIVVKSVATLDNLIELFN